MSLGTITWRRAGARAALLWTVAAGCDGSASSHTVPAAVGGMGGSIAVAAGERSTALPDAVAHAPMVDAGASAATESLQKPSASTASANIPVTAAEPEYHDIIAGEWEIAPGDNKILCHRMTADADLRINAFRTVQPAGTHHLGLYVSISPDKPDGTIDCSLFETGERMIVGAAPGSEAFRLPPGVANRIDQGNQLLLQLHLLNAADAPLRGRSIVQGVTLAKEQVKAEADVVTAQLLSLLVPPGESRAAGRCTFDHAQTLLAYGAHMHEAGRHAKVVLHRADGRDQMLGAGPFDFAEQRRYPLDLVEVGAGDYVEYECTFENATDRIIYWGENTSDEMCLVNLYRFPAGGETLCFL